MSDERPSEVLGALPRTRPHRRSDKRATRPDKDGPAAAVTPEAVDAVQAAVAAGDGEAKAEAAKPAKARPPAKAKAKPPARAKAPAGTKAPAKPKPPAKPRALAKPRAPARPKVPAAAKAADGVRDRIAAPAAKPARSRRGDVLGTAVQAAAELAEIGMTASARAIRRAVSRLPRP